MSRRGVRRALGGAAAMMVVAGGVAGCGSSGSKASATTAGSIVVYSGQHEQTTQALANAFEDKTGIKVEVRYNDEDTFVGQIETEGSHSPADVFYTENTPPLQVLQDKGLLAKLPSSTVDQTPARYDSTAGDWVGVSARVSVLIYNPKLISESQLPTTALGMADPKYKGKVAVAQGESDFYSIVTSMDRAYGQQKTLAWLKGLKENAGDGNHIYPDNETIADEVNRGQVAFGLVNQYYYYRLEAEVGKSNVHSAIVHFAPHDPGYVVDASGAGVLKSARDQAAAKQFVAFLVSKQGQEIIGHKSLSEEYPLDHGVTTGAPETPFAKLQPNSITVADLGTGAGAIKLMSEVGLT